MKITASDAAEWLAAHDDYLILTHRRPDGDAVGSGAALCLGLRSIGKRAALYANPQLTPLFEPWTLGLTAGEGAGAGMTVVAVDTSSVGLLPFGAEDLRVDLCLDHHGSNDDFADLTCVRPECAACCELIYEVLCRMAVTITPPIAQTLYLGLCTDTGCFQYANTTADTFRTAAALLDAGADAYAISKRMYGTRTMARLRLEAWLTEHLELYADGVVGLCALPNSDAEALGADEDDLDGIAGFPRGVEGVGIGVMLREVEDGKGKISLRTGTDYDSAAICAHLGGGGHFGAAGATVPGGIPGAREAILQAIEQETGLKVCRQGS